MPPSAATRAPRSRTAGRVPAARPATKRRAAEQPNADVSAANALALREAIFGRRVPPSELNRVEYGRSLNLSKIAAAISNANFGFMADLTDLGTEAIGVDPHLAHLLVKRFGQIRQRGWEVVPVSGDGIDKARAERNAAFVRQQIAAIPDFGQAIVDIAWGLWDGRAAVETHWQWKVPQFDTLGMAKPIWSPVEFQWVHPRRLAFGPERELRLVDPSAYSLFGESGVALRDKVVGKFIDFRPRMFREYPEREGIAPRALYWTFFKRFGMRERMILLELFGKPWKIVEWDPAFDVADGTDLDDAAEIADSLGSALAARMPKGAKLRIENPDPKSGEIHDAVCRYADDQLSKLVLWHNAVSDAKSDGLNGSTADHAQDQQDLVLSNDAGLIGERFDACLCKPLILHNLGPSELAYAPTFRIPVQAQPNRQAELNRLKTLVVDLGMPAAAGQVYEVSGFRAPAKNEARVEMVASGMDSFGQPLPPRPMVVQPAVDVAPNAATPAPVVVEDTPRPTFELTPSDVAIVINVNQALASLGLPPKTLVGGAPDPDGFLSVAEYKAKHAGTIATASAADKGAVAPLPPAAPGQPQDAPPAAPAPASPAPAAEPAEAPSAPAVATAEAGPETGPAPKLTDDWAIFNGLMGPLAATITELAPTAAGDGATNFPAAGDNLRPSLKNSAFKVYPPEEAQALRDQAPSVWEMGSTLLGNLMFGRLAAVAARRGVVETDTEEEAVRLREAWAAKHHGDTGGQAVLSALRWLVVLDMGLAKMRRVVAEERQRGEVQRYADRAHAGHACAKQPASANGSPESLIARGVAKGADLTAGWAKTLTAAAKGSTGVAIRKAMERAAKGIDLAPMAKAVEMALLHGAMLGAVDAHYEMDHGPVKPESFDWSGAEPLLLAGQANFATKPFQEAISWFNSKEILPRPLFDKLSAAAKRKAFTIAGLARDEMLATAKSELSNVIAAGKDLRTFCNALAARFEDAGWTPLKPSHVEVVFRNATMGGYSSGRVKQMTQPAVLAARPYWQIMGPRDGVLPEGRSRKAHYAARGKVLRASDPFWKRAPLPWGHNCRDRVVSRSERDIERLGLTVTDGSELSGLPDEGWDSSISLL